MFIVEDEPLARDELKYLLLRTGQVEVVGEAEDIAVAAEAIRRTAPDLVFLDIHLDQENGLQLAEQMIQWEKPPFLVFATAYDQYAMQAFELTALDYVLKPFNEERIRATLHKINQLSKLSAAHQLAAKGGRADKRPGPLPERKLPITHDGRITLVEIRRIVFIGTEERHVFVQTVDAKYPLDTPLYELERKLEGSPFLRVHRGYLINLDYVQEIEPWFNGTLNLLLKGGFKVPVSRSYVRELKQCLGL
ncbi:LytR/AlgR family response regulator transcription factor [Brevibacillus marinus]|uniref:LytR/AlgR family response regulator transcription factor n=1 Tax=Brevibacillus marinus TaxID=2496837 RepID=UPI001F493739|nr:LytTR family transcriptional regulator DNA-binding domain-containing protein [Brevibacillus marinus]